MAAYINTKEATTFLDIDPLGESAILLYNMDIVEASGHQKKPNLVTVNYASLTNIKNCVGHDELVESAPCTNMCQLLTRAFISTLPPFLASKRIALPNLSLNMVPPTFLKAIQAYNRKAAGKATIFINNNNKE